MAGLWSLPYQVLWKTLDKLGRQQIEELIPTDRTSFDAPWSHDRFWLVGIDRIVGPTDRPHLFPQTFYLGLLDGSAWVFLIRSAQNNTLGRIVERTKQRLRRKLLSLQIGDESSRYHRDRDLGLELTTIRRYINDCHSFALRCENDTASVVIEEMRDFLAALFPVENSGDSTTMAKLWEYREQQGTSIRREEWKRRSREELRLMIEAIRYGYNDLVMHILDHEAIEQPIDKALVMAVRQRDKTLVSLFLKRGAYIYECGARLLDLCVRHNEPSLLALLLTYSKRSTIIVLLQSQNFIERAYEIEQCDLLMTMIDFVDKKEVYRRALLTAVRRGNVEAVREMLGRKKIDGDWIGYRLVMTAYKYISDEKRLRSMVEALLG